MTGYVATQPRRLAQARGVPVRVPTVVGLGHIHQVALAVEGPGVIGAHDVVVLDSPLCKAGRKVLRQVKLGSMHCQQHVSAAQ